MPSPVSNLGEEQERERDKLKLKCPICNCTFPNKEFYDSHHLIEAKHISDMMYEECPGFIDAMAKIEDNQREIKEITRKIEFLKGVSKRQATFEVEQQNREIEFIKGIKQSATEFKEEKQQRELRKKKGFEELKACLREGKTPTTEGLYRLVSED